MVACALVFEASTPFVSARAILSHLGLRRSQLYLVNGVLMVVVFLCCRILVYPVFYYVYGAQRGLGLIQAVRSTPTHCTIFMLMVGLPQIYWFNVMLRGAFKVMRDMENGKALPAKNGEAKKEM